MTQTSAAEKTAPGQVQSLPSENADSMAREFRDRFAEELTRVLDVRTWQTGWDLGRDYARLEQEVCQSLQQEEQLQHLVRCHLFPGLFQAGTPFGVYQARVEVLRTIHQQVLFCGQVEACDGIGQIYETLPLTIYQIGVSLVSYRGDQGTWYQRLFRRDLRQQGPDPLKEMTEFLERRRRQDAQEGPEGVLSELVRKALLDYAERAVLLHQSQAIWRLGHGNPITYELLTGGSVLTVMLAATRVLRSLIGAHRKFVFVAHEPRQRLLLTIGQVLRPLQYALVYPLDQMLRHWLHQRRFLENTFGKLPWDDGEEIPSAEWIPRFLDEVASRVVVGVYRASALAPPHLFYAHEDYAHYAAHLVLADSLLREQSGFPLLLELAGHVCQAVFGRSLERLAESAYARAGVPWRYPGRQALPDY